MAVHYDVEGPVAVGLAVAVLTGARGTFCAGAGRHGTPAS
jgi:hypothetical protein